MISIICPSKNGAVIAFKLQKSLNAKLYIKENNNEVSEDNVDRNYSNITNTKIIYEDEKNIIRYGKDFKLSDVTKEAMESSNGIIFISSTGIAVRAIAPFIKGKDKDPGVVVVDLSCKYAINILSGHLGGGNDLTKNVSEILNAMPIITTATDNLGIIGPDIIAKNNELIIDDLKIAKNIAALLVDNIIIGIKDDYNNIQISKGYKIINEIEDNCIWITHDLTTDSNKENVLKLIKRDIVLGIGCRRNTSFEKLKSFIEDTLKTYNLDARSVKKIVSVDVKKDEEGIISLAEHLNCPFETFDIESIKTVQDKYEKSEFVLKTLGVSSVCEPCVDLAYAEFIVHKIKHEGMTLAIGKMK